MKIQYDLEHVYDEQIAPLMAQIITICETHGLPMIATFAYKRDGDENDFCTSSIDSLNRAPVDMRLAVGFLIRQGVTSE
jgi:hypothetical protein